MTFKVHVLHYNKNKVEILVPHEVIEAFVEETNFDDNDTDYAYGIAISVVKVINAAETRVLFCSDLKVYDLTKGRDVISNSTSEAAQYYNSLENSNLIAFQSEEKYTSSDFLEALLQVYICEKSKKTLCRNKIEYKKACSSLLDGTFKLLC